MNMSKEEIAAIMSLAKKILQHQNDKANDLKVIRKSEDEHDMTGRPGPGNCECHDD